VGQLSLRSIDLTILLGIKKTVLEVEGVVIVPIYKKGIKTDCRNYRDISLCQLHTQFYTTSYAEKLLRNIMWISTQQIIYQSHILPSSNTW